MIRRPPRSTLSLHDALPIFRQKPNFGTNCRRRRGRGRARWNGLRSMRSEEHTSELQSQSNLLYPLFFFNDTATTEIYTFPTRRSSDLPSKAEFWHKLSAPARPWPSEVEWFEKY